jgi:probable metal-binding protein
MDAAQLIDFLAARGKFRGSEEGFTVATENVCQH